MSMNIGNDSEVRWLAMKQLDLVPALLLASYVD